MFKCFVCGAPADKICSDCCAIAYCSEACQRRDRSAHKSSCKTLALLTYAKLRDLSAATQSVGVKKRSRKNDPEGEDERPPAKVGLGL
jgi:hypothetical protein